MAILNLQTYLYVAGAALLAGALIAGGVVWKWKEGQIDDLNTNYEMQRLRTELAISRSEGELNKYKYDFQNNLGAKYDELNQTYAQRVDAINASVGKLAGIRLQDPYAKPGNPGSTGTPGSTSGGSGANPGSPALSAEASEFLLGLTAESDIILERLRVCKAADDSFRTEYDSYRKGIAQVRADLKKQGYDVKTKAD